MAKNRMPSLRSLDENQRKLVREIANKFENRIKGKKGADQKRDVFYTRLTKWIDSKQKSDVLTHDQNHERRLKAWREKSALSLAEKAGQFYDEHGYSRGDYMNTEYVDFIPPYESHRPPYFDMGGEGLAVVCVTRKRVYARSSHWFPSYARTYYLVGKNEAGTYFAHPVPPVNSVFDAIQWIWNGQAERIIQRQGDIALIWGAGRKIPVLPPGHRVVNGQIIHDSHPPIPVPSKGQKIIVGRRAAARVSRATRD